MRETLKGLGVFAAAVAVPAFSVAMGSAGTFLFPISALVAIFLTIPLLMPNGKWLLACVAIFALLVAALLTDYFWSARTGEFAEVVGLGIVALSCIAFAIGALSKFIILRIKNRRQSFLADGRVSSHGDK
jgi:hypothetical protein